MNSVCLGIWEQCPQVSPCQWSLGRWRCCKVTYWKESLSLGYLKGWKVVETASLAPVPCEFQNLYFSSSPRALHLKWENRCSLQLVSPISSLIYPRRELCFGNSNVFNLGRCARCLPDSIKLQRKYQIQTLCLYFNEIFLLVSAPGSHCSCPHLCPLPPSPL